MAQIHPTAILEGEIDLADDVEIGPYCVLTGPITLAAGNRLIGGVWLNGPLTMGSNNTCYPGACLGFAPQDRKWDPQKAGAGVTVGDGNIFREGVTIHRATSDDRPTSIGNQTMWMANSHAGHDCAIGDHGAFANGTTFGGHVTIGERVVTGGYATIHQFCRAGRGAMLSGLAGLSRDLPPYFMLSGINCAASLNVIGLRRSGMPDEDIQTVRWVFKTMQRNGLSLNAAIEQLESRADEPLVREYLDFIEAAKKSKRGICPGTADPRR